MNIITRIKNNLIYAHHRNQVDKALVNMYKHIHDADDTEFKKWSKIGLKSLKIMGEIPLK